jgi:hypothetical protein
MDPLTVPTGGLEQRLRSVKIITDLASTVDEVRFSCDLASSRLLGEVSKQLWERVDTLWNDRQQQLW